MRNIKLNILSIILLASLNAFAAEDWSRINTCEYNDSENESLITDLIGKMSIEQKVGQVIQGDLDFFQRDYLGLELEIHHLP